MLSERQRATAIEQRYQSPSMDSCSLGCGNAMNLLDIAAGEQILDLGCGSGEDVLQAAKKVTETGFAVGLDLTERMIERAKEAAQKQQVKNVFFVKADIEALPFEENRFDGVTSNCVINHASDKERVYREIRRVLKKGGRFVVSDAVTKTPLPDDVKQDPVAWGECFGGAVTEEEYLEGILRAGFDKIEILERREYLKNGYDFISLTIRAVK